MHDNDPIALLLNNEQLPSLLSQTYLSDLIEKYFLSVKSNEKFATQQEKIEKLRFKLGGLIERSTLRKLEMTEKFLSVKQVFTKNMLNVSDEDLKRSDDVIVELYLRSKFNFDKLTANTNFLERCDDLIKVLQLQTIDFLKVTFEVMLKENKSDICEVLLNKMKEIDFQIYEQCLLQSHLGGSKLTILEKTEKEDLLVSQFTSKAVKVVLAADFFNVFEMIAVRKLTTELKSDPLLNMGCQGESEKLFAIVKETLDLKEIISKNSSFEAKREVKTDIFFYLDKWQISIDEIWKNKIKSNQKVKYQVLKRLLKFEPLEVVFNLEAKEGVAEIMHLARLMDDYNDSFVAKVVEKSNVTLKDIFEKLEKERAHLSFMEITFLEKMYGLSIIKPFDMVTLGQLTSK